MSKAWAAGVCTALACACSSSWVDHVAYADGFFRFPPFTTLPSDANSGDATQPRVGDGATTATAAKQISSSEQATGGSGTSSGFDPESLERGAKVLREINSSPHAKQVFDIMRRQEDSRLAELAVEKAHFQAMQSLSDIDKGKKVAEEQRNLVQQQAQAKAQTARYEDELARKRMQADHEVQRRHNVELVKMQEESSLRKEQARRATEEQMQAQQLQTEKEKAEIERETIRVKAMAEAEASAHEAKLTEGQNRRLLVERINGEREKWIAALNTTFGHIEGGFKMLLTDRNKLMLAIGGATAVAAGVYTTREGARVIWGYINRILGQPSLIRESSMSRFPWGRKFLFQGTSTISLTGKMVKPRENGSNFDHIILHPSLKRRIDQLARATANTRSHQAPFRNMLFYGPPGTGKTMVAMEMARKSGLDYAMMTGGDVAPLGSEAVTKIHQLFDWAKKSRKGLLLFIDEADAFLCERNSRHMSEAQRSALNALLFRTGDQSKDIVLVLATNKPGDLDAAISDRIDEVIEFPLPGEEERFKLLKLYLDKYIVSGSSTESRWTSFFGPTQQKISFEDISEDVIREASKKTKGFSGREIAKLMASIQASVYGRRDCTLDADLFLQVVDYKVKEHEQRIKVSHDGTHKRPRDA